MALRAVTAEVQRVPRAKRQQSVKSAADSGDRLALLMALRARIAADVDDANTPSRDLAALSRRLLEIAKDIEAINGKSGDDDISAAVAVPDEGWPSS